MSIETRRPQWGRLLKKYIGITLGTVIYSAGLGLLLDPNDLAPGGIFGIAVILNNFIPISTGILYFILNVPLAVFGIKRFGWRLMIPTVYVLALSSALTSLCAYVPAFSDDLLISALSGAVLQGAGMGLIFRFGGTTGGSDILVKALRQKNKHLKTGMIFFLTDLMVVIASGIVFRNFNLAVYALIAVAVAGVAMDAILYGKDETKLLFIISDKEEVISERIMKELDVGVTTLEGQGAYTGSSKKVIMCAAKRHVAPFVEDIVKQEDKTAFLIITSASEIYGEGYKNIMAEKL